MHLIEFNHSRHFWQLVKQADPEYEKQRVVDFNGVSLIVQQTDMNAYQIVRNLSTDPAHYLNSEYSGYGNLIFVYCLIRKNPVLIS
jgi:hypothetical protein